MATNEEQKLQDALLNTYTFNLQFLNEYDNILGQRVAALDSFIGSGEYKERFHLEFIKDDGDFDIYDEANDSYIYNRKPKKWNSKAIVSTNFDTKSTINSLNPGMYNKSITDLSEEKYGLMGLNKLRILSDIKNYTSVRNEKISNNIKKVKSFNKFIFVGTLLGRHIPKILNKIKATNYFVCESNLEIFRLSLFVCDYSLLARDGRSVTFSIMQDETEFSNKLELFYNNFITDNTLFKYYSTNYNIENYFDRIINKVLSKDPFVFDYRMMLESISSITTRNFPKYNTLNFTKLNDTSNIFQDKNIIFLGAGPSLDIGIQWLKENQNKFIIVAMAAALKKLVEYDIKPDIITTLDPQDLVIDQFQGTSSTTLQNTVKIASLNTPDIVMDLLDSESLFTYEVLKSLQKNNPLLDGITIGEVTFKILLLLKAKNIYLLGIDLALNQKTGKTHSDSHACNAHGHKIDIDKKDNQSMLDNTFSLRDDTVLVKGNLIDKVITTRLFNRSVEDYNKFIELNKQANQNIYNLSENGAYIQDTIPTKIIDLELDYEDIDKSELYISLVANLTEISVKDLETIDKNNLKDEILQIDNIIEFIEKFSKIKIKSYTQFKEQLDEIFTNIKYMRSYSTILPEIYINFDFAINRYIDYIFNDRMVKNDIKDLKHIQYIWSIHITELIKQYKSYLQRLI